MNIHIINCAASADRREFMRRQLARVSLEARFFNAVTVADIDEEIEKRHRFDWVRPMRKSEIALFYSHEQLWRKVADSGKPALIMEDDVLLSKNLPAVLRRLETPPAAGIHLVNLEVYNCPKYLGRTTQSMDEGYTLCPIYINKAGTGGYVLYPSGAAKLLAARQKHGIALSDVYIYKPGRLSSLQIEPACLIQTSVCPAYNLLPAQTLLASTHSQCPPANLIFKIKRLASEAELLFYKTRFLFKMVKRPVKLNAADFDL